MDRDDKPDSPAASLIASGKGDIIAEAGPGWFDLSDHQQRVWLSLAHRVFPNLVRLFQPRLVFIAYHGPYEAWLSVADENLSRTECGPINLVEVK